VTEEKEEEGRDGLRVNISIMDKCDASDAMGYDRRRSEL